MVMLPLFKKSSKSFTILLSFVMVSISVALYMKLGVAPLMTAFYSPEAVTERIKMGEARKLILLLKKQKFRLKATLEMSPKDAGLWWQLGEVCELGGELDEALQAFEKSCQLDKQNTNAIGYFLTLYSKHNKGKLSPTVAQLAQNLFLENNEHPIALNVLAIAAFQNKEYRQAISYWEKLRHSLKKNVNLDAELKQLIQKAHAELEAESTASSQKN